MAVRRPPPPPRYEEAIIRDLKRFRHGQVVAVGGKQKGSDLLAVATRLQRLLLVSVRPITAATAQAELTAAGRAALEEHESQ